MRDSISRDDAIDAIEQIRLSIWDVDIPSPTVPEYIEHHEQMRELMDKCDMLKRELVNLPSAERWIPCTERLPENNEDVLCCSFNGYFLIGLPYKVDRDISVVTGYFAECEQEIMPNCIAWMPLPEPYKGVTE